MTDQPTPPAGNAAKGNWLTAKYHAEGGFAGAARKNYADTVKGLQFWETKSDGFKGPAFTRVALVTAGAGLVADATFRSTSGPENEERSLGVRAAELVAGVLGIGGALFV